MISGGITKADILLSRLCLCRIFLGDSDPAHGVDLIQESLCESSLIWISQDRLFQFVEVGLLDFNGCDVFTQMVQLLDLDLR